MLLDYLWKGLQSGSATSAAKLEEALGRATVSGGGPVVFESYEFGAVRTALELCGLLDRDRRGS